MKPMLTMKPMKQTIDHTDAHDTEKESGTFNLCKHISKWRLINAKLPKQQPKPDCQGQPGSSSGDAVVLVDAPEAMTPEREEQPSEELPGNSQAAAETSGAQCMLRNIMRESGWDATD